MCTAAVSELQGSVSELTLIIVSINTTSSSADNKSTLVLKIPADLREITVSGLEPDILYSAVLTVTVHGRENITSDPATVRTTSGGFRSLP